MTSLPPSGDSVLEFLHLQREQAVIVVLKYNVMLIKSGLRETITAALDATNGNIRKVQNLSLHADPRRLMIYDDNRNKDLWEMSELLTGMLKNSD
ncbi:hypothetical protein [Nostoc sp. C117]|uniref:hypothetical protein n=1 Tax=Nostoc sp. C117 TaxID=3349875 RepID=UPI00370DDCB3